MDTVCAWCEHEGKPVAATGQRYGICDEHTARLVAQLHKYYPPRAATTDAGDELEAA